MNLSVQQKAFADYYIEFGNASEAYKRAYKGIKTDGAARANSSRLLKNQKIIDYISDRISQIEDSRIADAKEVMEYLTSVLRNEITEEVIVVVNTGDGVSSVRKIDKDISAKDRNKAAELLGKRYSLFTDKLKIEGTIPVVICGDDELED